MLESRIEVSFVLSDLSFHILPTSLRLGRGSYSCGAPVFLEWLKLKGFHLKSLPPSLEGLHTLTSRDSMDMKKSKNVCELSVKELGWILFFFSFCHMSQKIQGIWDIGCRPQWTDFSGSLLGFFPSLFACVKLTRWFIQPRHHRWTEITMTEAFPLLRYGRCLTAE